MDRTDLTQIGDFTWEIPASFREDMRVPVRILASEALIDNIVQGDAIGQAIETAQLPGLVGHLVVMPDVYQGQGAPVGMVAVSKWPVGAIAPGAIGHDINMGVRLLGSGIRKRSVNDDLDALADALQGYIPCGIDAEGTLQLSLSEIDHVAQSGAQWALRQDMAEQDDLVRAEEGGRLNDAAPAKVSEEARRMGARQLGTLGGGGHFIEVSVVEEVYNRAAAFTMGLRKGRLAVQIHCGSRAYGRQVCADYISHFQKAAAKYDIVPPSPNLACVPLESTDADRYMGAMAAAANYAYANRQVLTHRVREVFDDTLDGAGQKLKTVYDVAHNLGQIEMHQVEDKHMRCYVHRKGAARAFGPGTPGISLPYRALGQPVVIPGSVGESSWVLLATRESMKKSFGSACHGSGRTMSRHEANHHAGEVALDDVQEGLRVREAAESSNSGGVQLKENIDAVIDTVVGANVASKVARLKPLIVIHA